MNQVFVTLGKNSQGVRTPPPRANSTQFVKNQKSKSKIGLTKGIFFPIIITTNGCFKLNKTHVNIS